MSKTSGKSTKSLSKEEELLLKGYGKDVSAKSSALFYGNALIVSAVPIWLFWRIHQMEPLDYYIYFIIGTIASAYLINVAYKNVKHLLKHKIAQKIETADVTDDKKKNDDNSLWKKDSVADFEATTFSIFYNNSFFLFFLMITSFFFFKNLSPAFNYLISILLASGLAALFSSGSK